MASNKVKVKVQADTSKAEKNINGFTKTLGSFKGVALAAGAAFLAGFGAKVLNDSIKAAQVQEDAINSLNVALKSTGQFSAKASEDFQKFASSIQTASKFGDEAILTNASLLISIGKLSGEGLKEATQASVDMAAALKIDLRSAMTLVGKAAAGEIGSLSRYGVIVKRGKDNAETFRNTLDSLGKSFGGAAKGELNTYSGATTQLSNSFGDLLEEIGFFITKNPLVIDTVKGTTDAMQKAGQAVHEFYVQFQQNSESDIKMRLSQITVQSWALNDALIELGKNAGGRTGAGFTSMRAELEELKNEEIELNARLQAIIDKRKEGRNKGGPGGEDDTAKSDALKADREAALLAEAEFIEMQNLMKAENRDSKFLALQEELGTEAAMKEEARLRALEQVKGAEKAELERRKKLSESKKKIAISDLKFEQLTNREKLTHGTQTLGLLAQATAVGGRKMFAITKAFKLSEAITSGILSVQRAFESAPYPLNLVNATAMGIISAGNVAKIASSSPPSFAGGGIVPGSSVSGDRVHAQVNSKEMILNGPQQAELFNGIKSGGLGGGDIVISIDGREIARAVRGQVDDGFDLGVAS